MTPAAAINSLRKNTQYFLSFYQITIAGDTGTSRPMNYYIDTRHGFTFTRPGRRLRNRQHNVPAYMMSSSAAAAGPNSIGFRTHSIRMEKEGAIAMGSIAGYPADTLGPDLMVTGALSGCSFCILADPNVANRIWVAHVKAGAAGGYNLRNHLQQNGHFSIAPNAAITVYGSRPAGGGPGYDSATEHVSIVGIRTGNTWAIWGQVYLPTHPTSPFSIARVDRVF